MTPCSPDPINEVLALAAQLVEDRLSSTELQRLESLVLHDEEARKAYVNYVSLHASLQIDHNPSARPSQYRQQPTRTIPTPVQSLLPSRSQLLVLACTALLTLVAAAAIVSSIVKSSSSQTLATITSTKNCKWDAGSLPTETGARLTSGRLRLAEGLATLEFHNGVVVHLEAPTDFELISPMKCVVHAGQLVASVPPQAKGFVVETPSSIVTDYGTEFGVSVSEDRSAFVRVFKGRVDTWHRKTGQTEVMHSGKAIRFEEQSYYSEHHAEQNVSTQNLKLADREGGRWIHITTASGSGRDAFVQPQEIPEDRRSDTLLLVKRPAPGWEQWERRAYMAFDLAELHGSQIVDAELRLQFAPTGFGYAALTPDATFRVYGLRSEDDLWKEEDLRWNNAPGCLEQGEPIDGRVLTEIGSFVIPQGEQNAAITITTPALTTFLNEDTNQRATIVVVRDTPGNAGSDLVHGIASRRHPSLSPPTLRLNLAPVAAESALSDNRQP